MSMSNEEAQRKFCPLTGGSRLGCKPSDCMHWIVDERNESNGDCATSIQAIATTELNTAITANKNK